MPFSGNWRANCLIRFLLGSIPRPRSQCSHRVLSRQTRYGHIRVPRNGLVCPSRAPGNALCGRFAFASRTDRKSSPL